MTAPVKFPGQQEDERILYTIRPHKVCLAILGLKIIAALALGISAVWLLPRVGASILVPTQIRVTLTFVLLGVLYTWFKLSSTTVTYLTDRRLIRFDTRPPASKRRRALFWTEVAKAKAFSPNMLIRMLRVGSVELRAKVNSDENVIVDNVYYFDDLVNYIDKILHLTHSSPAELKDIRPFVLRPKGKRDLPENQSGQNPTVKTL